VPGSTGPEREAGPPHIVIETRLSESSPRDQLGDEGWSGGEETLLIVGSLCLAILLFSTFLPWHHFSVNATWVRGPTPIAEVSVSGTDTTLGMGISVFTVLAGAYLAVTLIAGGRRSRSGPKVVAVWSLLATLLAGVEVVQGYTMPTVLFFPGLLNLTRMTMAWGLGAAMAAAIGSTICFGVLAMGRGDRVSVPRWPGRTMDRSASSAGTVANATGTTPAGSSRFAAIAAQGRRKALARFAPAILALLLLLGLGGAFGVYWLRTHRVRLENAAKIQAGMTVAEVESIIGPGESVSTETMRGPLLGRGPLDVAVVETRVWRQVHADGQKEQVTLQFVDGRLFAAPGPGLLGGLAAGEGAGPPAAPDRRPENPPVRAIAEAAPDPLNQALDKLRAGPKEQASGLALLAMMTPADFARDEVIGRTEPLLHNRDESIRCSAVRTFQVWASMDHREKLLTSLDDASPSVRRAACDAFVEWRDLRAIVPIARRLTVRSDRAWASQALAAMGRPAVDAVRPYLSHRDPEVIRSAADFLRNWGPLDANEEITVALAEARPDAPPEARVRAIHSFMSADPNVHAKRRPAVASALEAMLDDPSLGRHALVALSRWATADQAGAFIRLLSSHDAGTRHVAIDALGRIGGPEAAQQLGERLGEFFDRGKAIQALVAIGPASEPAMVRQLRNPDEQVRLGACQVLQAVGTRRSLSALQAIAGGDPNQQVAQAAARAYRTIGGRSQLARGSDSTEGDPAPGRSKRPLRPTRKP
jgi:HEAT repeat protein